MTNKEAIEVLQTSSIKQMSLTKVIVDGKFLSVKVALEKAIKALEQEPKTGHWIKGYTFPDGAYWKCDKCNELIKVKIPMRYCNNCGAKMETEADNGNDH